MRTLEHGPVAKEDVRRMTTVQLARLGLEVLNKHDLLVRCVTCGASWKPTPGRDGRLLPSDCVCPNQCNLY